MSHAHRLIHPHHHAPSPTTDEVRRFLTTICDETAADLDRIAAHKDPAALAQAMQSYWDAAVTALREKEPDSFFVHCADAVRASADWEQVAKERIHLHAEVEAVIKRRSFVEMLGARPAAEAGRA